MPIDKFKFVSPGVQVAEIDNSQLPDTPAEVGPVIVGRASRGPGLRPVQVNSMSEFVEIFGNPVPGGETQDAWRNPDAVATAYGSYAAQAYLRNSSPITYVRLLGDASPNNAGDGADGTPSANGGAGWKVGVAPSNSALGTAYGLFVMNSSSNSQFRATAGTALPTTAHWQQLFMQPQALFNCLVFLEGPTPQVKRQTLLLKLIPLVILH